MAYEDTACPCGDRKERETMLCAKCEAHFANRPELVEYRNINHSVEYRRSCTITLLSLARRRKKQMIATAY